MSEESRMKRAYADEKIMERIARTAKEEGTPKTIEQAIANALMHAKTVLMTEGEAMRLAEEIRPHVKDFLAQKANLDDQAIEFFKRVFPELGP